MPAHVDHACNQPAQPTSRKNSAVYGVLRLRRAAIQFITGRLIQALARLALILILVRVLSAPDFGVYMLIVGLSEMMLQLASFGILPLGRRYLPQLVREARARPFYALVALFVGMQLAVLGIVVFALWTVWGSLAEIAGFSAAQTDTAIVAVWLFLLVPAFRLACELLETLLEHGRSRLVAALMVLGRIAVVLLLLAVGADIDLRTVILIDVFVTGACLVLAHAMLWVSVVRLHAGGGETRLPLREMIRFAWHMAAVDLMGSTASPGALRLVLANTLGVVESGLFAFLQSIQRLVGRYLPGVLLRGLAMPMLLSRFALPGGRRFTESGAGLLIKGDLIIVVLGTIVIAVAGDAIVEWLSGGKFRGAGDTLLLLYLALAMLSQRSVIEMVMQINGQTRALRATALLSPIALLAVWSFSEHGLNVAILIIIAGMASANGIALCRLVRATGFSIDWRGQLVIYGSGALATSIAVALEVLGVPAMVAAALALGLFIGLQPVLKPFNQQEFDLVQRAAGRRTARLTLGLMYRGLQRS